MAVLLASVPRERASKDTGRPENTPSKRIVYALDALEVLPPMSEPASAPLVLGSVQ
jgi:hypothetical protein